MEIKDKHLIILIITCLVLLSLSLNLEPPEFRISEINKAMLDQKVTIQGSITRLKELPSVTFFELNNQNLTFVSFDDPHLRINQTIRVVGTVKLYNNSLEVIAEVIKHT